MSELETFIVGNPWKNRVFIRGPADAGVYGVGEATVHRKAKTAEGGNPSGNDRRGGTGR